MKDLAVLVPDNWYKAAVGQILAREGSLRVRTVSFDIFVDAERRDPGCLKPERILAGLSQSYRFTLVLFDHEGCGREEEAPESLEAEVCDRLRPHWGDRCAAVAVHPEIEVWAWVDSPHLAKALGWESLNGLRTWLNREKLWRGGKPSKPKEALCAALRKANVRRSSSIAGELASRVTLSRCQDRGFQKLKKVLRTWFGRSRPRRRKGRKK